MTDGETPTRAEGDVVVRLEDQVGDEPDPDRWCELVGRVLRAEGVERGELDVLLVDRATIAELNETHLGHVGPTDVLSFPLDADPAAADDPLASLAPRHLGDIVLCRAVAADQAPFHAGSLDAELTLLLVHGVLHVLGHDHAEDAERETMQARERIHLAAEGFAHPVEVAG